MCDGVPLELSHSQGAPGSAAALGLDASSPLPGPFSSPASSSMTPSALRPSQVPSHLSSAQGLPDLMLCSHTMPAKTRALVADRSHIDHKYSSVLSDRSAGPSALNESGPSKTTWFPLAQFLDTDAKGSVTTAMWQVIALWPPWSGCLRGS